MVKSILKLGNDGEGVCKSVKWNEENIMETELEKQAFSDVIIDEPKTPFLYYDSDSEECCEHGDDIEQHEFSVSEGILGHHSPDAEEIERRKRFLQMRSSHYKMKKDVDEDAEFLRNEE